jgi:hypothetical protein
VRGGRIPLFSGNTPGGCCTNVRSESLVATRGGR